MTTTGPIRVPMREASKGLTLTVEVHQPIHHRLLWRIGLALMRAGAWVMGLAGVEEIHRGRD